MFIFLLFKNRSELKSILYSQANPTILNLFSIVNCDSEIDVGATLQSTWLLSKI